MFITACWKKLETAYSLVGNLMNKITHLVHKCLLRAKYVPGIGVTLENMTHKAYSQGAYSPADE